MSESAKQAAPSFEELLALLDDALAQLDSDELTLEDAIATYERAVNIAASATDLLDSAELRIREIDSLLRPDSGNGESSADDLNNSN